MKCECTQFTTDKRKWAWNFALFFTVSAKPIRPIARMSRFIDSVYFGSIHQKNLSARDADNENPVTAYADWR